jgi:hypothetical protein
MGKLIKRRKKKEKKKKKPWASLHRLLKLDNMLYHRSSNGLICVALDSS